MSRLLEVFGATRFADPAWGLAALVVMGALVARSRSRPPALAFAPLAGWAAPRPKLRARRAALPTFLAVLAGLAAVVAAARPVVDERVPTTHAGVDLLFALDVSSSMTARDLDGVRTRLRVATDAASAFAAARPDDRIGLLTFARYPDLLCPPTLDHGALLRLVADVVPVEADGPEDATALGAATLRAAEALRADPRRSRAVVLFTDGEENVAVEGATDAIAPLHAAERCRELGVRVFVVVAGGGPDADRAAVADARRATRDLADLTGGRRLEAADAAGVAEACRVVDALARADAPVPETRVRDVFLPWLVGAIGLAVAARLLESAGAGGLP